MKLRLALLLDDREAAAVVRFVEDRCRGRDVQIVRELADRLRAHLPLEEVSAETTSSR